MDTTGAGDGFIGCLLYQLANDNVSLQYLKSLTKEKMEKYLDISNRFCSISVTKEGSIASYPRAKEISM